MYSLKFGIEITAIVVTMTLTKPSTSLINNMMTSGPRAKVGDILPVHIERPRDRKAFINHPDYMIYEPISLILKRELTLPV